MLFSIIIPALNEEKYLPHILTDLENQTLTDFEVLVVDAKSHDKTAEIAREFSKKIPLKVLETSQKNVSYSRNLGAKEAAGEYIFFIDSDNRIPSSFLERAAQDLKKNSYDILIPAVIPDRNTLWFRFVFFVSNTFVALTHFLKRPISTGGNFVIKKEVFLSLHGFDESIFVCEDHSFVHAAKLKGATVGFDRGLKVIFSMRRHDKEGLFLYWKYIVSTVYLLVFGDVRKHIYSYEMGGDYYEKKQKS